VLNLRIRLPKNRQSGAQPEINIRPWFLLLSLLHFFITTYTDTIIFGKARYASFPIYIFVKMIVFVLLMFFWQMLPAICSRIKNRHKETICFFKHFGVYFLIMLVFLFLTWPGVWRWDELFIISNASSLSIDYWQHWLTYLFYFISLSIIPFPAGVVFFQILVISLVVGWISYLTFQTFRPKFQWILLIPMLFPSVIDNNLYPMRICLFAFIEFLLVSSMVLNYESKKDISLYEIFLWGGLTAVVTTWRTETIFFAIAIPIVLFVFFRKRLDKISVLCYFLIAGILAAGIMGIQKIGESNQHSSDYSLTAILSPLSAIIKTDFKSDDPQGDLDTIDKVISARSMLENDGVAVYWAEGTRSYTQKDAENLNKVYLKLVINNLPVFLGNQWRLFSKATGFVRDTSNCTGNSAYLYSLTDEEIYDTFRGNYIFNQPINQELRKNVISALECRTYDSYEKTTVLYPVFYNVLPPLVILILIAIFGLIRRRSVYSVISFLVLVQTGIVFAAAPDKFFMYYLPTYICGYGLGILFFLSLRHKEL